MSFISPFARVLGLTSALCLLSTAQEPVAVGKGSYAAFPPPGSAFDKQKNIDRVEEVEKRQLYLVKDDGGPVPTNKWYQNLIFQQYGTGLWSYPHKVDATKEGIEIFYPTKPAGDGSRMVTDFPLVLTGKDFKPLDSRAKAWTDWTIAFRMFESDTRFVDVTLGEGMPYVWSEFVGVQPLIALGGNPGKGSRGKNAATFFDLAGKAAQLPVTSDTLGITYEGRSYGVFVPDGTKFEQGADGISVAFSGTSSYLVVCPLPAARDLPIFHKHAFAIPRDTKLSWAYDRTAGTCSTTWRVTTEALKGVEKSIFHGWLPHHWRESKNNLAFDGIAYPTIRGQMRCAVGNEFTLTYAYNGILPNFPAAKTGLDAERMKTYLATYFAKDKGFARDTYAAGKDLTRFTQAAFIAAQTKDSSLAPILASVRAELENWFTFTPGEKDRFFAYYPRRKGLVGFNSSYGSEHFTDNHFHYGYFTFAAGMMCQLAPDFAAAYGEMAKAITKTYANYDRTDRRFPFFRAFDIWRGHSFADGNGFPDGNNQESTGESLNSWVGMILLGEALGDADLTAAGVMGYTFETRATLEYWFDPHGDVFPPEFKHDAVGMIWCNSIVWGTWFTASPAWIYGIQWLPSAPWSAFYDRDPKLIQKIYADMNREFTAFEEKEAAKKPGYTPKPADIASHGGELGSYHLGFIMHADPQFALEQLDKLWPLPGDKIAHNAWMANIYYEAAALRELGRADFTIHGSSPTSMAYTNAAKKTRTFIAWNPTAKPQTVTFYQGTKPLVKLEVPPHGIASKLN